MDRRYDTVMFDLDGTLVKTDPSYWRTVVPKALAEMGVTACTDASLDSFWYECARDDVIREHFGVEPDAFWQAYRRNEDVVLRSRTASLYEDVNFLKYLKQAGYSPSVVTAAPDKIAVLEIGLLEKRLGKVFSEVVLARESNGLRQKPFPDGLLECMKRLNVQPERAVYVGNGLEDIAAAKAAGVLDIWIDRGEYEFPKPDCSVRILSLYHLRSQVGL